MASAATTDNRASSGSAATNTASVRSTSQAQQQKDAAATQQQGAGPQDPDKGLMAQSCFDFMMIEMVDMSQRLAEELHQRELKITGGRSAQVRRRNQQQQGGTAGKEQEVEKLDEDEIREATFFRLEGLGYRVGLGLVER